MNATLITKHKVIETERERGWGSDYEILYFDSKEKAQTYCEKINSRNTSPTAPDYYVQAEYDGMVSGVMIDQNGKAVFKELKG